MNDVRRKRCRLRTRSAYDLALNVARTRRKERKKEGVEMCAAKREKKTEKMRAVQLKKREKEEVSAFIVRRSVFIPS